MMRRIRLVKMLAILAIAAASAVTLLLYVTRSKPVLFTSADSTKASLERDPLFSIFNPFRDRAPERSAESFLQLISSGRCEQALAPLAMKPDSRRYHCQMEKEDPLKSWRLADRKEQSSTGAQLFFRVARKNYADYAGKVWVNVQRRDDRWHVIDYSAIY
ncbi:MAG: hypothetical protein AB1898_33340 [Acidobacteriota bacterium]